MLFNSSTQIVKAVGSPRVKLLYDIYHMQIMEGDLVHTIRDNHQHIAHYHTAGVPGRHEIDESQELFYPAVMRAIRDSHEAQMSRMYHTLGLNCTTELLRAIDRSVRYDRWHHVLAGATFFLDGIPTQCKGALQARGLLAPRGKGKLPDLDREWSVAGGAAAASGIP